jgi:hypothetical protein
VRVEEAKRQADQRRIDEAEQAGVAAEDVEAAGLVELSLLNISEPTRPEPIS